MEGGNNKLYIHFGVFNGFFESQLTASLHFRLTVICLIGPETADSDKKKLSRIKRKQRVRETLPLECGLATIVKMIFFSWIRNMIECTHKTNAKKSHTPKPHDERIYLR